MSFSNQIIVNDWNWRTAHHGYVESRREQVRQQEELAMQEKPIRDTQISSMHEMGEMKRARESRVDEFSIQKFRESHEIIQRLTSQVQELQERMNYLNDSGEFQEVESNKSLSFSHVSSQQARIPSPRSLLSRDQRLPPDTWNWSGSQENVFANPRSTLESSQTPFRGIHQCATPSAVGEVPVLISTGAPFAREEERIGNTIPMPTFASRPSTMRSFSPVDIPQSSMVGQQ